MKNKPHKLFISHSSKDAEYMKAFVDLLVAIGVHKNQITCTSVPQCNIPVGCNIYDWLAKQFQTSDLHVVYAFSDNYYSSVATLNEMGAAWVMRCKWTGLLLPGFIFDKLAGCIDKNQICIKSGLVCIFRTSFCDRALRVLSVMHTGKRSLECNNASACILSVLADLCPVYPDIVILLGQILIRKHLQMVGKLILQLLISFF